MGWVTPNAKSIRDNKMHATTDKTAGGIQARIYIQQQISDSLQKSKARSHLFQLKAIQDEPWQPKQKCKIATHSPQVFAPVQPKAPLLLLVKKNVMLSTNFRK